MDWNITHIDETDSTNRWLRDNRTSFRESPCLPPSMTVVVAEYQTEGRGCGTNTWESERGQNLLFSMLVHPTELPASQQFYISMTISLAISEALEQYIGDVSIKWPNDIYWRNGKICGILIENVLKGTTIKESIIGVGLNVNQREFRSKAPNPVSLWQICGQETDRELLLKDILRRFSQRMSPVGGWDEVSTAYRSRLYRRKGFHPYADGDGPFMAEFVTVEDDGHLLLRDDNGRQRRYAFKEVQFII